MDSKKLFFDDRLKGICSYCGGIPDTRDHVPSKILLDEPYPNNLPVVEACSSCNQGFSSSEEYLACFIECVIHGSTIPNENFREKVTSTLNARPALANKIERSKKLHDDGYMLWMPDEARVQAVVLKLARGHLVYELALQHNEPPEFIEIFPIHSQTSEKVESFFSLPSCSLYPEIGSRAFESLYSGIDTGFERWHVIQENRYQYAVGQSEGDWVKVLINNFLACHLAWY